MSCGRIYHSSAGLQGPRPSAHPIPSPSPHPGRLRAFVFCLWERGRSLLSLECLSTLLFFTLANSLLFFKTQFKYDHIWDTEEHAVTLHLCRPHGSRFSVLPATPHTPSTWLWRHQWARLSLPLRQQEPKSGALPQRWRAAGTRSVLDSEWINQEITSQLTGKHKKTQGSAGQQFPEV